MPKVHKRACHSSSFSGPVTRLAPKKSRRISTSAPKIYVGQKSKKMQSLVVVGCKLWGSSKFSSQVLEHNAAYLIHTSTSKGCLASAAAVRTDRIESLENQRTKAMAKRPRPPVFLSQLECDRCERCVGPLKLEENDFEFSFFNQTS